MSADGHKINSGDMEHFSSLMHRSDPDGAPNPSVLNSLIGQQQTMNNGRLSPATKHQQQGDKTSSPTNKGGKASPRITEEQQLSPTNARGNGNGSTVGGASNMNNSGGPLLGLGSAEHKIRPGEFVMRILFSEFTAQAEKKIESVMTESPERSLSKSLQRGEDPAFDQLLVALGSVSEHCLPSILRTLFAWYDRQAVAWLGNPMASGSVSSGTSSSLTTSMEYVEKEQISLDPHVVERRDMAVEFIFCLVLIEVLKQLPFHPGHHDLVGKIEDLSFAHFKYREGSGMNAANGLVIADLYAEVLGILAQARFGSVRVRFLSELAELRGKESTTPVTQSIVSLLMGMKFFRIKMAPIEDFEAAFQFLTECAKYFLEVKQRDIKHALAGLFVEILVPVAATVKHEVNVPCLKSFMEMLYVPTLDMCTRSKHRLALFPLVTCLLCVSQRPFFLHNWHYFLAMCLSQLKSREPKMSRVALESLYRLLWAYMIRIKCESNSATQSRLLSVVNSLFPKGSKGVVPRDTPLNIFVKIIQFIAQERLDFAMREIVYELLSVGRPIKIILTPERMNIGLRAFLVAADSLQQKDGDPPMPRSVGVMPSGNTLLRVKKTFLNKVLTEDAAKSIGMASYFPRIRKVFTDILRALDLQCGRPLMLTSVKEQEESLLTGDRKAKIDLFRTCVAAIPRLIPDGMSRTELLSLLSRLTLHIDEELRGLAFQSLQSLLMDFPDWRNDVLAEFVAFASKEVPDSAPQQLDNALRMLLQLLTSWKLVLTSNGYVDNSNKGNNQEDDKEKDRLTVTAASTITSARIQPSDQHFGSGFGKSSARTASGAAAAAAVGTVLPNLQTFHQTEGLALVMLCSVRSSSRRLGAHMLKEIKILSDILGLTETPVLDVLDKICPSCCENVSNMNILPPSEKQAILGAISSNSLDLQWLTDRSCPAWYTQQDEEAPVVQPPTTTLGLLQTPVTSHVVYSDAVITTRNDPWAHCLKEFLDYQNIPTRCPRTVVEAWSLLMPKITALYNYLEPSPVADNRASLLRSAATPRKPPTDRNLYFKLWRNYLLFAFRTVPLNVGSGVTLRCISPEMGMSSSPEAAPEGRDGRSPLPITSAMLCSVSPSSLYKLLLPLIRSDAADIRDLAVRSLGLINHMALKDVFDDLSPYLREACDRKQENVRRRKRKDNLRLQIVRILKLMAKEKTFSRIASTVNTMGHSSYIPSCHGSGHHLSGLNCQFGGSGGSPVSLPLPLIEFLEMSRGWLETETDREGGTEIRINFCKAIHYLLNSFEIEMRENLLKKELRKQLFNLCIGWAGPYSHSWGKDLNTSSSSSSSGSTSNAGCSPGVGQYSELEFAALKAAAALLTCGPCFQQSLLPEESQLYSWIDFLLSSPDPIISDLAEQVIILLLEFNPDVGSVLDWAVSRCFTGSPQIANACFRATATLFSVREYPCDRYVAIINTALLYSGCPNVDLQQTAFRLLQVLDRRFFGGLPAFHFHHHHHGGQDGKDELAPNTLDGVLGKLSFAKSQTFLSNQLSLIHPELTMPMFSEISWRMKSARSDVRQSLLRYIQPWLHNMELVEPAIPSPNIITPLRNFVSGCQSISTSSSCSLCGKKYYDMGDRLVRRGWGSIEATEMVLNNLLYLTAKFGEEHDREVEECWQTLCCLSSNNQRVVLCYLLIVTGLAPNEILPHAKRVLVYLFRACPAKLLEDLMSELQTVESLNWLVERTETPPFYRLSHLRKTSSYSDNQPPLYNSGALPTAGQSHNTSANTNNQFIRLNTSELEKGTIHTKRRSAEESTVFQQPPHLRSSSSGTGNLFRTEKARTISGPAAIFSGPAALADQYNYASSEDKQFLASEREKTRSALYETETLYSRGRDRRSQDEHKLFEQHQYPSSETIAAGNQGFMGNTSNTSGNSGLTDEGVEQEAYSSKLVPLPMPEYGGYYAPLKEFFPAQPVSPYHRCNLAMMFVAELVNEGTVITVASDDSKHKRVEWCSQYLPLLIHMAFLGLDHLRPLVHQHSYDLLMNLLVVVGSHRNHLSVAKMLLYQQAKDLKMGLSLPSVALPSFNFLDSSTDFATAGFPSRLPTIETLNIISPNGGTPNHSPKSESPRTPSRRAHSPVNLLLVIPEPHDYANVKRPLTTQEMTLAFIKFLAEHNGQPLWACEDITAKLWNIRSANQLFALLQNTLKIFTSAFPESNLEKRWSQVSLQIGLACSSRHYAGRSLQVYRALKVPLVSRTLCDILSRLVETVAETGDDMQGYVTELILTLETSVEAIPKDADEKVRWMSSDESYINDDDIIEPDSNFKSSSPVYRNKGELSPPVMRARSGTETFRTELKRPVELSRSRSVQSLNGFHQHGGGDQDSLDRNITLENGNEVIPQVFWLALSLLESDYEHEYLLALRLLEKVAERLPLERLDCRDKLERIQTQLQWSSFGGAIPLILKGCTNPNTYEQSLSVLCRFIPSLDLSFIDATGETGFPLTVMALMPYLLTHYEDPPPLCLEAAQLIAEVAGEKGNNGSQPLHHLATVMTLYSRRTFTKESFQWNKCVIKYLYDSYSHLATLLLGFLLDVLEKGPPFIHSAVLAALYCSFNYVDLTTVGTVSPELLRAVEKHIDGPHWRESLKILKLVVTRSSFFVVPPPAPSHGSYSSGVGPGAVAPTPPMLSYAGNSGPPSMAWDSVSTTSSAFSSDLELNLKKELPGRTMEFTFDVSQTPVIGRRHLSSNTKEEVNARLSLGGFANSGGGLVQRSSSVGEIGIASASSGIISSAWKRPWQCQSRVRECLVSVLNTCGQRVGLPKSPSVIFSQSSELLERQSSVASSTEEMSVAINDTSGASRLEEGSASDAHFRVFRDFDFLEYELESVDGDSTDNFNWGVRRRPLSEVGTEPETEGEADNEMLPKPSSSSHSLSGSDQTTVITKSNTVSGTGHVSMQLSEDYLGMHNAEESSDEDDIGLSPLDEAVPQLQGLISDPPTPQPHSLTMIEIASLSQISSPARSRRLSDTSLDSRSEEETTPSNVSPQGEFHGDGEGETEEGAVNFVPEIENDGHGDGDIGTAHSPANLQEMRLNEEDRPNLDLLYDSI